MLYLRMCKIPFSKKASSYRKSAKGALPHLHRHRDAHGADTYMEFLKSTEPKWNLDANLSANDLVLARALSTHVRRTMKLIISYMMWMDDENKRHTYKVFGATFPFVVRNLFL